jgi:hypothetical protein
MARCAVTASQAAPSAARERAARSPAGGRIDSAPILVLQRTAGNRAVGRVLLQRRVDLTAKPAVARFKIDTDLSPELAQLAWAVTIDGVLDDADIDLLRQVAQHRDESVNDNERMFMAALLDTHNVEQLHQEFPSGFFTGEIAFPVSSVTAPNRARIRDFGRAFTREGDRLLNAPTSGPRQAAIRKARFRELILDTAGPRFATTARDTLALADATGVGYDTLYRAMIAAASDSTAGDRALAAAAYVIASRDGSSVAADLLAGRVKVDEVDASVIKAQGDNVVAFYLPSAGTQADQTTYGLKGDTVYLVSAFDVSDLFQQSIVVHELRHAERDRDTSPPASIPRVDVEAEAFLAHTLYQLKEIAKLSGADRDHAIDSMAQQSSEAELMSLFANADIAPDARTRADYTKIAQEINARATKPLTATDFTDRYGSPLDETGWTDEAAAAVRRRYKLHPFTKRKYRFDGLRGESALD